METNHQSDQKIVEYWETERLPSMHKTSSEFRNALKLSYTPETLRLLFEAPFLPFEEIERKQFKRIKELVSLAYEKIPVYREKYQKEGFRHFKVKVKEPNLLHDSEKRIYLFNI